MAVDFRQSFIKKTRDGLSSPAVLHSSLYLLLQLHMAEHPAGHLEEAGKEGKKTHTCRSFWACWVDFNIGSRKLLRWRNSNISLFSVSLSLSLLMSASLAPQSASAGYWWTQWGRTNWRAGSESTEELWCSAGQCTHTHTHTHIR